MVNQANNNQESMKEYVDRYKEKYKSFDPVYSPALNEEIHFTSEGMNHLLFKRGHRRKNRQIKYRLPLLNLVIPTIKRCKSSSKAEAKEEIYKGKKIDAMYFELTSIVGKKEPCKIKVVIKRRGKLGKLFFLSVMKQKTPR